MSLSSNMILLINSFNLYEHFIYIHFSFENLVARVINIDYNVHSSVDLIST